MFRSAWGQFGWLEFRLDDHWFEALRRAWSLSVLGAIAAVTLRIVRPREQHGWWRVGPAAFAAATLLVGVLFILFAEYYARIHLQVSYVIQGRNFLFALPAFAVVIVVALGSLVPARFRTLSAACIVIAAFALNAGSLVAIVNQQYGG